MNTHQFRKYLVAAAAMLVGPAFAGNNICWFDHISSEGDRLVLHFSSNASLSLWGQGKTYLVAGGRIHPTDGNNRASDAVVDVSLASGDTMTGFARIEDSCTYTATERDGQRGLLIKSSNGGFAPSSSATVFLLPE
jgi:hypothetical protein